VWAVDEKIVLLRRRRRRPKASGSDHEALGRESCKREECEENLHGYELCNSLVVWPACSVLGASLCHLA